MRHVLSGNIPTRVPGVREAPTELPEPAVASTFVPAPVVAETDLPVDLSVATALPAQAVVPTELPFWIRKIMGVLAGQAEIRVQVLTWDMAGTEALRGQGAIVVEPVSIDTGAPTQALRGRGAISALASMVLPAGVRELAGRGAVLVSALMSLPAGVRELGARGAVGAAVSTVSMSAGTRTLAGRGAIGVAGVTRTLNIPTYQMTKSGTQAGQGTGYNTLTGMGADPSYPGTIVDNSAALRIPDGIPAYAATIRVEVPHTGGSSPRYGQSQIYMNGSLVATGAQQSASPGTSVADWSGTVQAGDYFVIQWRGEGNFFQRPTAQAGAFLRVTPQ